MEREAEQDQRADEKPVEPVAQRMGRLLSDRRAQTDRLFGELDTKANPLLLLATLAQREGTLHEASKARGQT